MSTDTVDDLQGAEDHIAGLHAATAAIATALDAVGRAWQDLTDAVTRLQGLSAEPWCRPSCQAGDCEDDCGCLAHADDEDHHPPDTD